MKWSSTIQYEYHTCLTEKLVETGGTTGIVGDLKSGGSLNTFAARYLNTQGLNNSYLKSP